LVLKASTVSQKYLSDAHFSVQKAYGHLGKKQQILLKMFAANFNKLCGQGLEWMGLLLLSGREVAQCCLPFSIYRRKLALNCAKAIAAYSKMDKQGGGQALALQTLKYLLICDKKSTEGQTSSDLYDFTIKKLYNEFAKESKVGGGGFQVQNNLRMA